ncbi:MAG TPA: carboxypeptidase regulatory-like domain-containing protein, partial [Vicinamibacterales bacterium]|nr:carboxypeptidase regulatory-like domain-containing protein [Vicinamibacterales bacterium]
FTGRIDVTVEDSTGGRLPGVNVDIAGPTNQTQVTDTQGQAHFLNLPVGTYSLKTSISGFNPYTNANVQVATAAATPVAVKLGVAGQSEVVNVTAATPVIDTKRETTTTNVTLEELQNIPSARDPWVVMQTVPSIYVDRVNVGGSESGQQSNYIGKGAAGTDNTWNIDGIPVTDMGATGSSSTYYDFDMFQEMAVTTGGADAANPTPGVQLNMVLKKGSNTPHGGANLYFENQSLQSNNLPADLAASLGGVSGKGNRTDKYLDDGFDLGGPVLKDRVWAWGRIGRTNVRNLTLTGSPDETILNNYALKADAQLNNSIRSGFTFFEGNKVKNGRSVGPTRLPETGWNQTGPTKMYKGDGNFVVGQNLFAAARVAYISGGFQLAPAGGLTPNVYQDADGVYHGSYELYVTNRPQYYAGGDASYFAGKHEVKFGFSWRKTPVDSLSQWPGSRIVTFVDSSGYPNLQAQVTQDLISSTVGRYVNGFVTDTISLSRLTVIAGIRYDRSTSSLNTSTTPAVPGFETILPAKTVNGVDNAYAFNTVTPRVGITYALDESRKTIARASYALFASQLPANAASFISPAQYSYATYSAVDKNGNNVADPNEIGALIGTRGFDPSNPGAISTANKIGSINSPRTQEILVGVDREVAPSFGVSATVTYRYFNNFLWNPPVGATTADYVQTGTLTGTFANVGTVNVPYYGLTQAAAAAGGFGYEAENRPDYHQRYLGFELSATKRLANHWMGRFGFSTQSWNEYFDAPDAIVDPTRTPSATGPFNNLTQSGPLINGGAVVVSSTGSGKSGLFLVAPKYILSANGLYQGPWGIDLGANITARQGYGEPYNRTRVSASDALVSSKTLLLGPSADANRLPGVVEFDARLEKMFKFQRTSFALDLDVFNILNRATVLGIQYDARVGAYNQTLEIQNPRIARLGVRFTF